MHATSDVSTLVALMRHRAHSQPDRRAYTLLVNGEGEKTHLTYRQLDQQARALGARLQRLNLAGERALLLYPTSLEYMAAFAGCLYAGVVPVPAYPPRLSRPDPRIEAIVADARATVALTSRSLLDKTQAYIEQSPELKALRCLGTSVDDPVGQAEEWQAPPLTGESLAFIQYTSGSTASPKGVMLSHSNLLHNVSRMQQKFGISVEEQRESSGVSWVPLYHDAGLILGAMLCLYAGGPLIMIPPEAFVQRPASWLEAISRCRYTFSGAPSFAYQLCLDRITPEERAELDLSNWRLAFCGGEPVRAGTLERFAETFAPHGFRQEALCPVYGLAEATVMVAAKVGSTTPNDYSLQRTALEQGKVVENRRGEQSGWRLANCGRPLPDHQIAIVDPSSLTRSPVDSVGEIWVSGPSVAQGYWRNPEETEHTFQAYLVDSGEGPFLRTGDLGFLKDGELVVTGRLKDLVIIHGRNYHPEDIELTAQQSHPALQPDGAAAFSIGVDGQEQLVIVHELKRQHRKADTDAVARAIRRAVAQEQELAVYAVVLIGPGRIPRTSSGKIRRQQCRTSFLSDRIKTIGVSWLGELYSSERRDPHAGVLDAPRTPMEMALAEIWRDILEIDQVGVNDNFFELGGDSLKATQVVSRLRAAFRVELPLHSLFETPTVAELAAHLERALPEGPALQIPPIEPVSRDGHLPLSFAQERMWFLHQLDRDSSAYNIPGALRLKGLLDRSALEQSLHEIVRRHEAFRTTFATVDGRLVQIISPLSQPFLEKIDLRGLPGPERESQAMKRIQAEARRPFDLKLGPLLRVFLLQTEDQEHILFFNMHHIISDAWSLGLLTGEVLELYNSHVTGKAVQLPSLPVQYADFAVWQREWLRAEVLEALLADWKEQLDGVPALELPTDHPRPVLQSYRGAVKSAEIPTDLLDGLKRLSTREGVTLFMTLLAVFEILLYRYTGQEDIAISVPIANRNWFAIEGVVGSFVNTLVMRVDLSGNPTVHEPLGRVCKVALRAYAHQDMPYAKLVAELQPERDTSRTPLAQVMFNVVNVAMPPLQLKELQASPLEVDRQGAQLDLTLTVVDNDLMSQIAVEYNADLFAADTIERMLGHLRSLLQAVVTDSGQKISSLPMLTEAERQLLVVAWNDTWTDYPENCTFVELFEDQVERSASAPALVFDGQEMSYRVLNRRANQVAHHLRSLNVGPEMIVGVMLERSMDMVVGVLAVLKAGAAYLPLDPSYPEGRLAFMLRDADAPVLLTKEHLVGRVPQHGATLVCLDADSEAIGQQTTKNPPRVTDADSLAYVLYTSGSTGRPKGVLGPYRGAVSRLAWMWKTYPFQPGEVSCQKTRMTFIDSVGELFGSLLQGVPLVILPDGVVRDPQQLVQSLAANRVTRIVLVPSLLKAVLDTYPDLQDRVPDLRIWLCGGEPLSLELVQRFRETMPQSTLLNMYGSSEVAVDVTWYDTSQLKADSSSVPIGRPIANTQIYLLDSHLNPVPRGVPGEIYVGGVNLARGYVDRPNLTAERFISNPFSDDPAARLYKMGDLGRYLPDGNIEYLGRRDHQVKIRGFRVELGEIEAALRQHPAVAQAAVIAVAEQGRATSPSMTTEHRVVAYLVVAESTSLTTKDLRCFLEDKLPAHMIPSGFVFPDALPLNLHGKIDRLALAELGEPSVQGGADYAAPRDEIERQLAQIWEEVLDIKPIGIRDDFFDLGGHSLLAVRLFARINEVLGTELPVASLFQSPTIAQLGETIRQAEGVPDWSVLVPIQPGGSCAPFFCVHGAGGGVMGYAKLARVLGPNQPLYGLQAKGWDGVGKPQNRVEDMAAHYIAAVRTLRPNGPYCLGGYSFGGTVAFEMARQLEEQGEQVGLLAMFDTYTPDTLAKRRLWHPPTLTATLRNLPYWLLDIWRRDDGLQRLLGRLRIGGRPLGHQVSRDSEADDGPQASGPGGLAERERFRALLEAHDEAERAYHPQVYPGQVTLFCVRARRLFRAGDPEQGWGELAADGVEIASIPGAHYDILEAPQVDDLAAELKTKLAQAQITPHARGTGGGSLQSIPEESAAGRQAT